MPLLLEPPPRPYQVRPQADRRAQPRKDRWLACTVEGKILAEGVHLPTVLQIAKDCGEADPIVIRTGS